MTTGVRITQGTFSYLPELTDDEIRAQIQYGIDNGWAVAIEFTDDPHPRNVYWDMWGMPMFDIEDAAAGLLEVNRCRKAYPNRYIRVSLYNATLTKQTVALQFIVNRPPHEPGFRLLRQETTDRIVRYTLEPYAARDPHGERYDGSD
ncbi:MAG: ribulose bisphosphate carboxylase small subunit [Actinobacteria bacterium]|nr:ribulose bisphosphate carboxylase small subunit [Actinomycetota bacterium]MDQ3530884.1 ribulose bisphosphate carboxylase small subunit [Actinomycetota bacterium]